LGAHATDYQQHDRCQCYQRDRGRANLHLHLDALIVAARFRDGRLERGIECSLVPFDDGQPFGDNLA
jgi:hypothetical protein